MTVPSEGPSQEPSRFQQYIGQTLFDSDGHRIGRIGAVFLADATEQPEWFTVSTGFFGTHESFVPVAGARLLEGGLSVPWTREKVQNAPNVDLDHGQLSGQEEVDLYRFYGLAPAGVDPAPVVEPEPAADIGVETVTGYTATSDDYGSNAGRTDLVQQDEDYDDGSDFGRVDRNRPADPDEVVAVEVVAVTADGQVRRLRRWVEDVDVIR